MADIPIAVPIGGHARPRKKSRTCEAEVAEGDDACKVVATPLPDGCVFDFYIWATYGGLCRLRASRASDSDRVCSDFPGRRWGYPARAHDARKEAQVLYLCMKRF